MDDFTYFVAFHPLGQMSAANFIAVYGAAGCLHVFYGILRLNATAGLKNRTARLVYGSVYTVIVLL
jgi:hypothetical protein